MEKNPDNKKTKKYWLSLEQWSQDKDFQNLAKDNKEFLNPLPSQEEASGLWERREFLQLMAASLALAGFGCVRRPTEKIVPYVNRPKDITLGQANYYSSSYYDGEEGFGILVKTRQGRPIKIEGNPDHPLHQGALSARAHAHILSLYDPERLKNPQKNLFNKTKSNSEAIQVDYSKVDEELSQNIVQGKTAFLTGEYPSPSSTRLLRDFCNAHSCAHFVWNPLNHFDIESAQKLCHGKALVPHIELDKARFILSINCDFLGTWLYPTEFNRLYSKRRKANSDMNRLMVFESTLSLTGTNADQRIRIKPSQEIDLVLSLIHSLMQKNLVKNTWPSHLKRPSSEVWKSFSVSKLMWDRLVTELWTNRRHSVILAGGIQQNIPLQIAVGWLNHLLQNDGSTINYSFPYQTWTWANRNIEELIKNLEEEKIQTLIIHKTNPLYHYPDKQRLESAIKKAKMVVYTGDREDETGKLAHYILPDHHDLEKWSDWEFQKGVFSIGQPTIRPLYQTRAFEDALIEWTKKLNKTGFLDGANSWYTFLKKNISSRIGISWNQFLKKGVYINKTSDRKSTFPARAFKSSALFAIKPEKVFQKEKSTYELVLYSTIGLKEGSLSNVSWLQEFPDPVTKICWDNYLCVSPLLARQQKLKEGQIVILRTRDQKWRIPIHIQPGQTDKVLALSVGYGRKRAGKIANKVGVNAWPMLNKPKETVSIDPTDQSVLLANTQGHHSMEGRQIVVDTTLKKYLKNPGGAIHRHKVFSLWSSHKYPKHKWGMVIDLNSCTGCSACVVACQSENNVPTVGKKLVLQGREMHWIRIDRYYKGKPKEPETVHQPVTCMHCDNAPCETVCPVAATVHSDEGTNDMIYNRCVGTRYCANNCPYKVRRFNWFNYSKKQEKPLNKALNPEVTVRSRGVMEKCTFCIHRVRSAQAKAKLENRSLKADEIQTACQQSCPTGAIVFGDLNNKNSKVHRLFKREDSYALLEELNTQPAVRYRVKVRNKMIEKESKEDKHHHG